MNLLETLALLTFILALLSLVVDAMITKKIDRLTVPQLERSIFLTNGMES